MSENKQYIVSARKYRPATFSTVVGQEALTRTLKNAIDTGRLAQAYLFCGPRGVGKTSCARIFARTINCLNPTADGEACGECDSCRSMNEGNSFNIIELDAASNNSVEDIRSLTEQVNIPPQIGKYRVFIIDEVHMLSNAAFNAFLKTLEEPPKYVIFILATTEKHKVIPTILSRCQIYDFKRITVDDMVRHLSFVAAQEGIEADPAALNVIAQKADGAMRDALSIFDQVAASSMGNVTYESAIANLNVLDYDYYFRLIDTFMSGDVAEALLIYKEIRDKGFDSLFFINGLASHVRDITVAYDARTIGLLEVSREVGQRYVDQAKTVPVSWCYEALTLLNDADLNYRTATNKQLLTEITLIRLCRLNTTTANPKEPAPLKSVAASASAPVKNDSVKPQAKPIVTTSPQSAEKQSAATEILKPVLRPASQPIATPPAQPARTTQRKAAPTIRIHRVSDDAPDTGVSQSTSTVGDADLAESFTDESLHTVWNEYIESNKEKHILKSAMEKYAPVRISDSQLKVMVENPAQRQAYESDMRNLVGFLRSKLRNYSISLVVEMMEMEARPRKLTQIEFLTKVVEENPSVRRIIEGLDMEMA
jgi:DNA polymerase-3 subunit gamma/tau